MTRKGLYDPKDERGSCGTGFVADASGRRGRRVLGLALEALGNLVHRGAVAADGRSGDGAGILTQLPYPLLRRELEANGVEGVADSDLALGVFFLPRDDDAARRATAIVEGALAECAVGLLLWRDVPVDAGALGEIAARRAPRIRQAFLRRPPGWGDDAYDRRLYLARRKITRRVRRAPGLEGFSMPSFSRRTVVYKGLMLASQLDAFYRDLKDDDFTTAIAVFHQRYSTNTLPDWSLAQPFRLLAHNGEINTLGGNVNWMEARERELAQVLESDEIAECFPVIGDGGSDSAMLDNVLEFLVTYGRDPLHALMMMIPPDDNAPMDAEQRAFHDFQATLMEPWDGPAAVALSDGRFAAALLDRNGLRPQRYWQTEDGLVVLGSEAGIVDLPVSDVVRKGRLGPGQMLAVDTATGTVLGDAELKHAYARRQPYRQWLERRKRTLPRLPEAPPPVEASLLEPQLAFGYSRETLERMLVPMMTDGTVPVGSMGDDTPLAALSQHPQRLYRFFKQRFAQVTNPPIDPLRERTAMSLRTMVGPWGVVTEDREETAPVIDFPSPVLSGGELAWLLERDAPFRCHTVDATFAPGEDLETALKRLTGEAESGVDAGAALVVLSDRGVSAERLPVPMLLLTSAVHHHLIRARKRMQVSLVCDTGEAREDHHVACLIGYGATLVHPWLAYATVARLTEDDGRDVETSCRNFRRALESGLLKIMSKLGVCPVASYQGAQLFEVLGLDRGLVERYFPGTRSPLGGLGLDAIEDQVRECHGLAFAGGLDVLPDLGLYRFRKEGEYHALHPGVFKALHAAVRSGDRDAWRRYSLPVEERPPVHLRDFLTFKRAPEPLELDEVEPAESIVKRFFTAAMSHGALSREAHEVLAVAMNRLGARSSSGEGGEDRRRFRPYDDDPMDVSHSGWRPRRGDWGASAIRQVASGRFGVTPEYLATAREIEIKMAQGSKPGEGGQIPGHKVTKEIAAQRFATPGVPLISPPPHHDIYSIEDLAQLVYDLKRVNPRARVGVKLVSLTGVGTIAAGVAKAYADFIQLSGADGGTGASPLGSIRHAGLPWEIGLAEAQQVLIRNGLRERVSLRVDGGLQNGRDVVMATLLGAEEFGFGTTALVAVGCVMARQCHLDTCPVGIATQRPELRRRFPGVPENLISFMLFVAEEVRHILADLGERRLEDVVGRTNLLEIREEALRRSGAGLDLAPLLHVPEGSGARRRVWERNDPPAQREPLDEVVWRGCRGAIHGSRPIVRRYEIRNRDRSVGARLGGEIAVETGGRGLAKAHVEVYFTGTAGQSFAAFLERGLRFVLEGEAQDYVGKGMHGGEVVIRPPRGARFAAHENVIAGNTVLYGATGGRLFVAGQVGERFAVRNSGAKAVVEGCGAHGCEYMTGGKVAILGEVGRNFAAGMSGGVAYVYDEADVLERRLNGASAELERVSTSLDVRTLRRLLVVHLELTHSERARFILDNWDDALDRFWKVAPRVEVARVEIAEEHRVRSAA